MVYWPVFSLVFVHTISSLYIRSPSLIGILLTVRDRAYGIEFVHTLLVLGWLGVKYSKPYLPFEGRTYDLSTSCKHRSRSTLVCTELLSHIRTQDKLLLEILFYEIVYTNSCSYIRTSIKCVLCSLSTYVLFDESTYDSLSLVTLALGRGDRI
jgi:hypothetical protein